MLANTRDFNGSGKQDNIFYVFYVWGGPAGGNSRIHRDKTHGGDKNVFMFQVI